MDIDHMVSIKTSPREPVSCIQFGSSQKRRKDIFRVIRLFSHLQIERDITVEKININDLKLN